MFETSHKIHQVELKNFDLIRQNAWNAKICPEDQVN